MRFANLHYTRGVSNPADAPKGQLPYITHGDDVVADSTFIIKYLEATYGRPPPYSSLRPLNRHQQAIAAACMAITSDRLTQGLMYYRFVPEEGLARHSQRDVNLLLNDDLMALSSCWETSGIWWEMHLVKQMQHCLGCLIK
ncbi:hypothetical protein ABBQ32_002737 [Trebouxia sp. C0010 RCD-2024]